MRDLIVGLYEDWIHLDERIETLAGICIDRREVPRARANISMLAWAVV
jgi:hypothetical protein